MVSNWKIKHLLFVQLYSCDNERFSLSCVLDVFYL